MDKHLNIWKLLGWILCIPVAFTSSVVITIILAIVSIKIGLTNQVFLDSIGSSIGNFLFIVLSGYFAPSQKFKVLKIVFWFTIIESALMQFIRVLGLFEIYGVEDPGLLPIALRLVSSVSAIATAHLYITKHRKSMVNIQGNQIKDYTNRLKYLFLTNSEYNSEDVTLIVDTGTKIATASCRDEASVGIFGSPYADELKSKRPDLHNGNTNFYFGVCRVVGQEIANGTPENIENLLKHTVQIKHGVADVAAK